MTQETHNPDPLHASLEALVAAISTISSCSDSQQIHAVILEQLAVLTDASGGSLFAFEKGALVLKHAIGINRELPPNLMFPLRPKSPSSLVIGAKKPLLVSTEIPQDASKGSGWPGYHDESFMVLPIMDAELNILCLVNLHNKKHPPFTQLDLDLARVMVASVGPSMARLVEAEAVRDHQTYLLQLLNELPAGFVLFERDGSIVDTNQAFAAFMGLDPDACLGLNFLDMSPESDWAKEQTALEETMTGQRPMFSKCLVRHDLKKVPVRVLYKAFLNTEQGRVLAVVTPA